MDARREELRRRLGELGFDDVRFAVLSNWLAQTAPMALARRPEYFT